MAVKGNWKSDYTAWSKKQGLKQQYEFAQKSIERYGNMLKDSLVPQQTYDEIFAKYQGAQAISLFKLN
jgi:HlyD family secretion protein